MDILHKLLRRSNILGFLQFVTYTHCVGLFGCLSFDLRMCVCVDVCVGEEEDVWEWGCLWMWIFVCVDVMC